MNVEKITVQDCIDMFNMKNEAVIINDGKITGFQKENIPADR